MIHKEANTKSNMCLT